MAQTAQVSVRVDADIKRNAETVLNDLGLNMSAAITIYLKKIAREHRIPFDLTLDPFYSASNLEHLRRGVAALNNGLGTEHEPFEDDEL